MRSVVFTLDGQKLISASADRTAIVWDLSRPINPVATLKGHAAAVRAIAISPDGGTVATASEDATDQALEDGLIGRSGRRCQERKV